MWNKITEVDYPEEGKEVIFFHPDLIDPDFNPKGTCFGHALREPVGDKVETIFFGALWNGEQDCYDFDELVMVPTHWTEVPDGPSG